MDAEELIKRTADQVRAALDGAQERADEIVREAEAEAQRIRSRAETEARERLDQVREALERLEAGLRGGSAPQGPSAEPDPQAAKPKPEQSASDPEPREPEAAQTEPKPERASTEELIEKLKAGGESANAESKPAAAVSKAASDDAGAARLVAMKLALDGTSRDEARDRLAADYDLPDLDALLQDVYSKAGK